MFFNENFFWYEVTHEGWYAINQIETIYVCVCVCVWDVGCLFCFRAFNAELSHFDKSLKQFS